MSGEVIFEARDIVKRFGGFTALNGVSVAFRSGQLTAIIGPNGAGKTTFFNIISGALRPSSGTLAFEGRGITGRAPQDFAHMGIGRSFQITNVFPLLSALENVRIAVQALHVRFDMWRPRARRRDLIDEAGRLLDLVGLYPERDKQAQFLSHGAQRCLEIAMALACRPRLLLLDEPTAGMSPEETREMMNLITRLASDHTVFLVEHKMKLIMGISDRIIVLHHGELLADGPPDEIRANAEVRDVYLGQGR